MVSQAFPAFIKEFRTLKLEAMIKDIHKLTPDELVKVQEEIAKLLGNRNQMGVDHD